MSYGRVARLFGAKQYVHARSHVFVSAIDTCRGAFAHRCSGTSISSKRTFSPDARLNRCTPDGPRRILNCGPAPSEIIIHNSLSRETMGSNLWRSFHEIASRRIDGILRRKESVTSHLGSLRYCPLPASPLDPSPQSRTILSRLR